MDLRMKLAKAVPVLWTSLDNHTPGPAPRRVTEAQQERRQFGKRIWWLLALPALIVAAPILAVAVANIEIRMLTKPSELETGSKRSLRS